MAKKPKGKKRQYSGRVSLYLPSELHGELANLAESLGVDLNGLIRMMIARSINYYRLEARTLEVKWGTNAEEIRRWEEENPGRPLRDFIDLSWRGTELRDLGLAQGLTVLQRKENENEAQAPKEEHHEQPKTKTSR